MIEYYTFKHRGADEEYKDLFSTENYITADAVFQFSASPGFSLEGKLVIVVSSEMPELLGICDRILVMSGGRLAGEVDARNTSQEEIMTLAAKYV